MRSTMLMPVEWAAVRNADTAKITELADKLRHDPYYYPALRSNTSTSGVMHRRIAYNPRPWHRAIETNKVLEVTKLTNTSQ